MSVWVHAGCGGRVFWDMSGGFCERCEEENLTRDEVEPIDWPGTHERRAGMSKCYYVLWTDQAGIRVWSGPYGTFQRAMDSAMQDPAFEAIVAMRGVPAMQSPV